jgi:ubiquinone/menaquinone biosynthesis C-methylase UbiE
MKEVNEFYEQYPYPFAELKNNSNLKGATLLKLIAHEIKANIFHEKLFLDAGCGTGHRILDVAKAFPNSQILGIDFSQRSIELAIKQAAKDKVHNIKFEISNIMEYDTDQLYDVITINGVINHLIDPRTSIANLSRFLKEDGILITFIAHTYGEYYKLLQRKLLLTLLSQSKYNFEEGVELMREMNFRISKDRFGQTYGNELSNKDELSKDADAFLHPHWMTFTFQEAIELFKNPYLDWISIEQIVGEEIGSVILALNPFNAKPFWVLDIKSLLKSEKVYRYYQNLNIVERLQIIELMAKPTGFTLIAGKSNSIALHSNRIRENSIFLE